MTCEGWRGARAEYMISLIKNGFNFLIILSHLNKHIKDLRWLLRVYWIVFEIAHARAGLVYMYTIVIHVYVHIL